VVDISDKKNKQWVERKLNKYEMGRITDIVKRILANHHFRMIGISLGILLCFFFYGIYQEKIMRGCYGGLGDKCTDGDKYKFELTLVGILCLWYAIVARGNQNLHPHKHLL
jgi:hypothetical protein